MSDISETTISVPERVIVKMQTLALEAMKPKVDFTNDIDEMAEQARSIKDQNMAAIYGYLNTIKGAE